MKCPKCDYLGFETGDRCKNCGYDFSLLASSPAEPTPDLPLKPPALESATPIGDLWLDSSGPEPSSSAGKDDHEPIEFPLFSPPDDDEPLIKRPSAPRAPLAVRRTPDNSRARSASRSPRPVEGGLSLEFADQRPAETAAPASETAAPVGRRTVVPKPMAAA